MEIQNKDTMVYEEEINLYDYWLVIAKRKMLILGIILIVTITTGIINIIMTKIYRIKSIVEIGKTQGLGKDGKEITILEEPAQVMTKIESVYPHNVPIRLGLSGADLPSLVAKNLNNSGILEVYCDSSEPEKGVRILGDIVQQLKEEHDILISNFIKDTENKIKNTVLQIEFLETAKTAVIEKMKINEKNKAEIQEQLQKTNSRIEDLLKEKGRLNLQANVDNTLANLLFTNEIQAHQHYRNELSEKLFKTLPMEYIEFKAATEDIGRKTKEAISSKEMLENQFKNIRNTKVLKLPTIDKSPIKPQIKRNIALAGMISLFIGMIWVFIVDYAETMREKNEAKLIGKDASIVNNK